MNGRTILHFALCALILIAGVRVASAFNATSTSFLIRQGIFGPAGGSSVNSFSTSTSFKGFGAGGQTGLGISTSTAFNVKAGFIQTLYDQSAASLSMIVDSATKSFGVHSPGTLSSATSSISVTTSNSTGFSLSVVRDDADTTLDLDSNALKNITDKTVWNAGVATTSAGNATASTTEPNTLQFRVRLAGTDTPNYASAWWGINDTTASALFAGFPSSNEEIANRSTVAAGGTITYVLYNLNTPVTQTTGGYSGSITYTVVVNP